MLSLCTFVVGLLVAASAPTMGVIVLGRALQGAGTGGLAPIAYILVKRAFPEDRQGSMFAFLSAGWVLPSLVAPAFGGLITDQASWRWVFLCIVPFAVVVALLATRPMRAYGPVTADHAPTRVPTAALAAIGIGALTYGAQDDRLAVAVVLVCRRRRGRVAGAAQAAAGGDDDRRRRPVRRDRVSHARRPRRSSVSTRSCRSPPTRSTARPRCCRASSSSAGRSAGRAASCGARATRARRRRRRRATASCCSRSAR